MSTTTDLITKTPGVCGGDACIRGSRITVRGLVEWRRLGLSDEEILRNVQGLTLSELQAGLEYAAENPLEIERTIWENHAAMEDRCDDFRLALIVRGWQLGLTDAEIAEPFDPPLSPDLQVFRQDYLARKDAFDQALPDLLPRTLREGLAADGLALCG